MTAQERVLREVAEVMTRGIRLRPTHIFCKMDDGHGGACAVGTLRAGYGIRDPRRFCPNMFLLSNALRARFEANTVPCNDVLHVPREAMVQVLCEDAGLA